MTEVSFLRHAGFFSPEDAETLNIIGVGATGSNIGLIAAKMGFHSFKVWDADIVESHNLPNQIYDVEHVGMRKVDAFKSVLQRFNPNIKVETHPYFFEASHKLLLDDGPLVLTVDTMSARKDIHSAFHMNYLVNKVYETRLGFDYGELNIVDNMNVVQSTNWVNCLRSDSELSEGPCNLRICTTLVGLVASYTVHTICASLSSKRSNVDCSGIKPKTVFNFAPQISTYSL